MKNAYDLLSNDLPAIWKKPVLDEDRLKMLNSTERAIREGCYKTNSLIE
jgi:hypothetical protein